MITETETPPACAASEGPNRTETLSPDDTPSPRDAQGRSPSPRDAASTCALLGADQVGGEGLVYFASCEPDYHVLRGIGWPAVAFNGRYAAGANTLLFANKRVILFRTKGDRLWAKRAHEVCHEYAGEVLQIRLDVPLYLLIGKHGDPERLTDDQKTAVLQVLTGLIDDAEPVAIEEGAPKASQATALTELAASAHLFHDRQGTAWATVRVGEHRETHEVKSTGFRQWLRRKYHEANGASPNTTAMQDAIADIEAEAIFGGDEDEAYLRTARTDDGCFIDLGDSTWRAVHVTADGWDVVENAPVCFHRAQGMASLPVPERGGSVEALRRFLNVDDDGFVLVVAFVLGALMPTGPYPILSLGGAPGCGKSMASRFVRKLIDPNVALLRRAPRDERDLFIAARNGRVVAFDNVSGIPGWLSDSLCAVSTGAGFAARALYSNGDEFVSNVCRPIILNGIASPGTRSDIRDRSLDVTLMRSFEDAGSTRTERELMREFEAAQPAIFGALLDAVAMALRRQDFVQLDARPRMMDFAKWVVAAEPALPWAAGGFMEAYMGARTAAAREAVDGSLLANAVLALLDGRNRWTGTATELLDRLNDQASETTRQNKAWPTSARGLSGELRRLAPDLARVSGVVMDYKREAGTGRRRYVIEKSPEIPSQPSQPSQPEVKPIQDNELRCDGHLTVGVACDGRTVTRDGRVTVGDETRPESKPLPANVLVGERDGRDGRFPMFSNKGNDSDDDLLAADPAYADRLLRTGCAR